jgi:hypothetical protein
MSWKIRVLAVQGLEASVYPVVSCNTALAVWWSPKFDSIEAKKPDSSSISSWNAARAWSTARLSQINLYSTFDIAVHSDTNPADDAVIDNGSIVGDCGARDLTANPIQHGLG